MLKHIEQQLSYNFIFVNGWFWVPAHSILEPNSWCFCGVCRSHWIPVTSRPSLPRFWLRPYQRSLHQSKDTEKPVEEEFLKTNPCKTNSKLTGICVWRLLKYRLKKMEIQPYIFVGHISVIRPGSVLLYNIP